MPCRATAGIQTLREKVDTLIVIPNDRLLDVADDRTSMLSAFRMADDVLLHGVQGITDLITTPGLINTDFADVRMIMQNAGSALMGIGHAERRQPGRQRGPGRDLEPAARGEPRGCPRPAPQRLGPVRPGTVRGQRGGRDRAGDRPPRRQHHLRGRHRRRDGRRDPHHRHRGRASTGSRASESRAALAEKREPATFLRDAPAGRSTPRPTTDPLERSRARPRRRAARPTSGGDEGDDDFDVPEFLR